MRLKNKAAEVNFVVLENVFNADFPLQEQYDLKVGIHTYIETSIGSLFSL